MKLRMDQVSRILLPKALRKRLGLGRALEPDAVDRAAAPMVLLDGIWLHQGISEPGIDWDNVVVDGREERIQSLLTWR